MRQVQWHKSSSCLRSLVCLKTRLIINVSKQGAFYGIVRHLSPTQFAKFPPTEFQNLHDFLHDTSKSVEVRPHLPPEAVLFCLLRLSAQKCPLCPLQMPSLSLEKISSLRYPWHRKHLRKDVPVRKWPRM